MADSSALMQGNTMKILKIVGVGFGVLVALVVAAMIIVPLVIDPNDYRDKITGVVKEQTGRELRIIDPMKISVFPWIGIKLGKVDFSNAPGFGDQPFAAIDSAQVKIKLLPLLRARVEMDTITLDGLRLNLARNKDGVSNWDDLVKPSAEEEKPEEPTGGDPLQALSDLAIGGVKVSNAYLLWDDQGKKQRAEISALNLTTGELNFEDPLPVSLDFDFALNQPEMKGHLRFASTVGLAVKEQRYSLQETELDIDAQGQMFPGGRMNARLRANAEADLQKQIARVSGLTVDALGSTIAAEVNAERILGNPAVKATLKAEVKDGKALTTPFAESLPAGFNAAALSGSTLDLAVDLDLEKQTLQPTTLKLRSMGTALDVTTSGEKLIDAPLLKGDVQFKVEDGNKLSSGIGKMMPEGFSGAALAGSSLTTRYAVDLGEAQSLNLNDLKLALLDIQLSGGVKGSQLKDAPSFKGDLKSNVFVPRDLLAKLKITLPEMADPSTLTKASLATSFDVGKDHAGVEKLAVQFDQSTLSGSASVKNFAKPILRYNLTLNEIDVDRYLPPPAESKEKAVKAAEPEKPVELPLKMMRGLDINGTARIGKLKVMNLRSEAITTTVNAREGLFRIYPLGAKLYQGTYSGNITFDVRGEKPLLGLDEKLTGVQAGPLLKDFMGKDYVTGKASVVAKITARGLEPSSIRQSLNGNASFSFVNGAVKGINIAQLIRDGYSAYKKQPAAPERAKQTDFAELRGSVVIHDGLVINDDLSAKSPLFRIGGKGNVHLVKETIDYRVEAAVVGSLEGQGGKEISDLKGLTVPIKISGTFTEPKFSLDMASLFEAKARAALEAEKQKAAERLDAEKKKAVDALKQRQDEEKKRLEEEAKKKLKNLLKF